jgi:4-alpha-glucanotransferase
MKVPTIQERASGLLLHPTSLPGRYGCGDLGDQAYRFADFLAGTRQSWWQMLPVHPIGPGNSPYRSMSVFALSPMLISLDLLERDGLLSGDETRPDYRLQESRVQFRATRRFRERCLRAAFSRLQSNPGHAYRPALEKFRAEQASWLADFALFAAVKQMKAGLSWTQWPEDLRDRQPAALASWRAELDEHVRYHEFLQYLAARQWGYLRQYCADRGIGLIGDLPIYVDHESADVWTHPDLFILDRTGKPTVVAGVPPDMFSATGQLWGNPLYRWEALKQQGYAWWLDRLRGELRYFDIVRLDHFIGFHRYWEVAAGAKTAQEGRYCPGPGAEFFKIAQEKLGRLPIIAEDLGVLTPEVEALRDQFKLPGMRILQFAFDSGTADNTHLPHHYPRNSVVYTGTHDNDTTVGWFFRGHDGEAVRRRSDLRRDQTYALDYLGSDPGDIHWSLIRLAFSSVSNTAIVPVQDLLGLGAEARMNLPGSPTGNWVWRMVENTLTPHLADRLRRASETFGRARG